MLMTGFTIDLADHIIACRLRILQGQLADLPTKAASANFKQFNRKFGCPVCLDPGAADEGNPLLRHYPYIPEKRLLDYLHQVLEGEFFRKLKCWFVTSKHQDMFCLKNVVTKFEKLTLNVKLPHDFPQKMRSICDLGIKLLTDDTILEQDRQLAEALLDSYIRLEKLPKWTARGQVSCPQCSLSYSTAWKPKNCKRCRFEIGGTFVPKDKRKKTTSPDAAVIVATSADGVAKIISVKANYREN
ncbi:Hypothetical predicted protein [Paramuricea clavata]|uniref:Uncharacterized protein n=1 Tax=Paramuricea clavata TaxID=317549 RepID=A0A7D9DA01_PARCT|nr:Hypothetical predicted protein [Paramuricea clavata]